MQLLPNLFSWHALPASVLAADTDEIGFALEAITHWHALSPATAGHNLCSDASVFMRCHSIQSLALFGLSRMTWGSA